MARTKTQGTTKIIEATIIEQGITPEQQAALEADMKELKQLSDIGAVLAKHDWVIPTITGVCATAGVCITAKVAATAAVTVATMIGGGMFTAYATFFGLLTIAVTMILKYRDTLMQWATALAVLVAKGLMYLYELACNFLGWLKEKCIALWNWFTSLFSSDEEKTVPANAQQVAA